MGLADFPSRVGTIAERWDAPYRACEASVCGGTVLAVARYMAHAIPDPVPDVDVAGGRFLPLAGIPRAHVSLGDAYCADLVVAEVEGSVAADRWVAAARSLQERFEVLGARLAEGPKPGLRFGGDEAGVPVVFHAAPWREAVREALRAPLGRSTPIAQVTVVPGTERTHVIVAAHHAVVDGRTLSRLLAEYLTLAAGEELPPGRCAVGLPVGALAPPPSWFRMLASGFSALWAARLRRIQQRSSVQGFRLVPGEPPPPVVECSTLDASLMRALAQRARHERASVGAALAAAAWQATRDVGLVRRAGGIETMVDLRRYLGDAAHVGMYAGGAVALPGWAPADPWRRARWSRWWVDRQMDWRLPLLPHYLADSVTDVAAYLRRRGVPLDANGGVGSVSQVSNVGLWNGRSAWGPLRLRAAWSAAAPLRTGPAMLAWLRTVDGQGCLSAVGNGAVVSPRRLRNWVEAIESNLTGMVHG